MNGSKTKSKAHLTPDGNKQLRRYKILYNRPIVPIPDNLKQWLLTYIIPKNKPIRNTHSKKLNNTLFKIKYESVKDHYNSVQNEFLSILRNIN